MFPKTKQFYDVRFNALKANFPEHYERVVDAIAATRYDRHQKDFDREDPMFIQGSTDEVLRRWSEGKTIDDATQIVVDWWAYYRKVNKNEPPVDSN